MAAFGYNTLCVANWVIFLTTFVIDGVHVPTVVDPVTVSDADGVVTLPCDFTTDTYETPQITWYMEGEERRRVMMFDIRNRLTSYGVFLNRVARGDRGALVLFRPTARDSGNYSCEIEVDKEIPAWVKGSVQLDVVRDNILSTTPHTNQQYEEAGRGLIFPLCIFYVVSFVCIYVLGTRGFVLRKNIFTRLTRMPAKDRQNIVIWTVLVLLVTSLVLIGTICLAYSLSSITSTQIARYKLIGLTIGIIGTLGLICLTIARTSSRFQRKTDKGESPDVRPENVPASPIAVASDDISEGNDTFQDARTHPVGESEVSVHPDVADEEHANLLKSTMMTTGKELGGFRKIQYPSDTCIGMASVSSTDIYVTRSSTLYYMNTEADDSAWVKILHGDEEFIMIAGYQKGFIICGKSYSKSFFLGTSEKYHILLCNVADKNVIKIDIGHPICWVLIGRNDAYLYVCNSEEGKVVRTNMQGGEHYVIGKHELRNPTSIAQNSNGHFIVTDSHKSDVFVFDEEGGFVTSLRTSVPKSVEKEVIGCHKVAVGPDDNIYVASSSPDNILVFSADYRFDRLLPTVAESPEDISAMTVHNNSLYVAYEDCIRIYTLPTDTHTEGDDHG